MPDLVAGVQCSCYAVYRRETANPRPHLDNMHDEVKAALSGLASALLAHPDDIRELEVYGDMACHLADVIADIERGDDPETIPTVKAYASRLEEATGFTIEAGRKDGEPCWWLVDPYGDREGDPWFCWSDLVSETLDTVEDHERELA